ncbi:MAG TPA: EthD family reductase [Candidatus Kapabacteria bacterium]|jgi:uncharacterized protein (TIGR02118 family)|nr:EthD family reductase [Candidatus Kapabacteria bacterium]
MHTLTAIYGAPENKDEFIKHYNEVHTPLVKQMEGIRKIEVTWVDKMLTPANGTLSAQPALVCTMYFDSEEALNIAMKSPGGRAAAKDLMSFAGPIVSMITGRMENAAL